MRDPVLAGFLSLLIPGVGQLYNGRILAGILWLIFTPGFWIGTGGTLGWMAGCSAAAAANGVLGGLLVPAMYALGVAGAVLGAAGGIAACQRAVGK